MRCLPITVLTLFIMHTTIAANENEDERKLKRKRRPCKRSEYGRTFFDWSFLYADVTHNYNYNHNYNINCGATPIVPAPQPPQHDSFVPGGGHHRPHKWDCKKLHGCREDGDGNNRFGLGGFLDLLFGGSKNKPVHDPAEVVDYEDQPVKPVSEDYDDVPPPESSFQNWKPGKYVGAYNPLVGGYVTSVNKLAKDVDRFFEPLYGYFQ